MTMALERVLEQLSLNESSSGAPGSVRGMFPPRLCGEHSSGYVPAHDMGIVGIFLSEERDR